MRKSGDKDFLAVLQNLETILQEQTKISKRQSTPKTPNSKTNSASMKSSKNKTASVDFREKNIKKEINKVNTKTSPPKRPRKLYKNTQENALISTYTEYSSSKNPKIKNKSLDFQSPQGYKNEVKSSTHSQFSSPKTKHRIRHNSPIEQVDNDNDNSYEYTGQNYTTSQLNTLCIFFLRWMKKCTEKIEAESQKKAISKNAQFEKTELNKNIQNEPNSITNTLANSNTLSIERVEYDPNNNQITQMNQIPSNKIEINATPKSFKTNLPSSIIRNSIKPTNLSPQQEKQNIEYLHPNCKANQSQDNSLTTKSTNQTPNSRKNNTNKRVNFSDSINMKKTRNTANNKTKSAKTLKDTTNDTSETNTDIKDNYSNENYTIENNENANTSDKNTNKEKTATNISATSKLINNNSNNNTNNFDSVEEICKIDLEETSPIPTSNVVRTMPSIGESDLNNQPNSEDIHYDSYELSEKSLSLLPPQGEGEVTDFNPSSF